MIQLGLICSLHRGVVKWQCLSGKQWCIEYAILFFLNDTCGQSNKYLIQSDSTPRRRSETPLSKSSLLVSYIFTVRINRQTMTYDWAVKCGNDQTFNDVLIDTGSGILWVGGEKPYEPGLHSQKCVVFQHSIADNPKCFIFFFFDSGSLNATFGVGYGVGSVSGNAFRDNVVIGDAVAKGQIVGASNKTQGFTLVSPIDGICRSFPSYVLHLFFQTLPTY